MAGRSQRVRRSWCLAAAGALLASGAAAQDGKVKLTKGVTLERLHGAPVVFSPDGRLLLYVKKTEEGTKAFTFVRARADGQDQTEVFRSTVDWDDVLTGYLGEGVFSSDGRRLLVVTTADGGSARDGQALKGVLLESDGANRALPLTKASCNGFGFAGDRVVLLEGNTWKERANTAWELAVLDGEKREVLDSGTDPIALGLRVSPDGKRAAFFLAQQTGQCVIRVVDLATKAKVDTPGFKADDYSFDGAPILYWDPKGGGVYYNAALGRTKRPFALLRFDIATKQVSRVVAEDNVALFAVADADHLLVMRMAGKRHAAVLRLKDKRFFRLAPDQIVIGARGKTLVVLDRKAETCYTATFELGD